jgi:hypothetical protein
MKKILFLLFLSTLVKAQIVPNQLTTTNYTKTIGYNGNYNRGALQDWDAKISKIQQATASTTASVVWIGDSWTVNNTVVPPISSYLRFKFGDAGCGYYGASSYNSGNTYGSDGQQVTFTEVGSWADVNSASYVNSAALAADSSSTLNDSIYYVGKMTNAVIHYMTKTSGGSFIYRVDGTSPATVSTAGTKALNFVSITGLTDGTHTLSIKVSTAASGVLICGAEINRNNNGVRIHNLGKSGATAADWVSQSATSFSAALQQFAPNMAVICLGVNDANGSVVPSTYISNITTIVNRVIAAMPNCAIVLFSPSDIGTSPAYSMSQYVSQLKTYALNNNYVFIDNYSLIGSYTTANARGLYANTAHLNTTGGNIFVQNFLNFLMNGQSMYYSSGLNTNYGELSLLNTVSSGTANVGFGYQALRYNTTGSQNTGIGYGASTSNTSGSQNTSIGFAALNLNTSGGSNTGIGYQALTANTTGSFNVAEGVRAMFSNKTGSNNVASGYLALNTNTTGNNNCGYGANSLFTNATGSQNTGIGYASAYTNATGSYNTGLGFQSLLLTNASNNTGVGAQAGYTNSSGTNNVFIGFQAGYYETGSSRLWIDNTSRSSLSDGQGKALITGTFAATAAAQTVQINAHTKLLHIIGNTTAPTATVGGGAGVGATYTLTNCTDVAGKISVTTATLPNTDDTVITLSFNTAYTAAPTVILTPANKATANLAKGQEVFASTSTTQLIITSNGTALGTPVVYAWYYHIIQ